MLRQYTCKVCGESHTVGKTSNKTTIPNEKDYICKECEQANEMFKNYQNYEDCILAYLKLKKNRKSL